MTRSSYLPWEDLRVFYEKISRLSVKRTSALLLDNFLAFGGKLVFHEGGPLNLPLSILHSRFSSLLWEDIVVFYGPEFWELFQVLFKKSFKDFVSLLWENVQVVCEKNFSSSIRYLPGQAGFHEIGPLDLPLSVLHSRSSSLLWEDIVVFLELLFFKKSF